MTRSDALTEIFNFMDHKVRVVILKGQDGGRAPWFVAVDVRRCLGVTQSGSNYSLLTENEKCLRGRTSLGLPGGRPIMLVSESGLYKLILKSRKPEAKAFQDWVTQVVLPAIRKDGMYVRGEEKVSAGEMDLEELTLITLTRLQEKMKRLKEEKEAAEALAKFSQGIITEHLEYVTMDE
ncbi:BRO family protein [Brucella sp. 10RB9214]|uniref:BRO-N domain-containing protein n=1 Tax=unclassified Brucella TaxID=2632610 RepID=UPI000972994D|nr:MULTISPECIES: Bro-N domain-containing protein [unclassified Brucella]APY15106.1 BRO family protein [Brucella sp. 09RB8910]MRN48097.1 BRO family protein [Brucella sp. 10RB9212]MRN51323.1 BRO family protein [Brucella sp. 10RB9214]